MRAPKPPPVQKFEESEEAKELYRTQARVAEENLAMSREQYDTWKKNFLPLSAKLTSQWERFTGEAENYDSEGRIAQEEGLAATDVASSYAQSRAGLRNTLGRYGMNPGSGRFAGALRSLAIGEAADTAGARTHARRGVLDRAINLRNMAFGQGASLAGMWQGVQSGANSLANTGQAGIGAAGQGFAGIAHSKRQAAASNYAAYTNAMGQYNQGLGSLAGGALTAFAFLSDQRMKDNIEKIGELRDGTIIYEFTYFDEPDIVYTGVLAQQLQETQPDLVIETDGLLYVNYEGLMLRNMEVAHG